MEREIIYYMSWDLTVSGPDLTASADRIKANYNKGVHKGRMLTFLTRAARMIHLGKMSSRRGKQLYPSLHQPRSLCHFPYRYAPVAVDSHLSTSSDPPPP